MMTHENDEKFIPTIAEWGKLYNDWARKIAKSLWKWGSEGDGPGRHAGGVLEDRGSFEEVSAREAAGADARWCVVRPCPPAGQMDSPP